jgi:NAD(P)-dependent dehydrogenase (short-subunit alcohol dehydrogenase family)
VAAATALAGAGADVVLAIRNAAKGTAAVETIRDAHPGAHLAVELVELGSLASIAACAERLRAAPVHILINNAGLSTDDPEARTSDGFDLQVGVNYLGGYALTAGLWPTLRTSGARVVMLGSMVSARGRIEPGFGEPRGSTFRSYCDSKLATVVFAGELRRRIQKAGSPVTVAAAHPGWCQTAIFDLGGPPAFVDVMGRLTGALQSPADGSQPILTAATADDPAPYYGPQRKRGSCGPAGPTSLPEPALEPRIGERLWEMSVDLTGLTIEP